MPAPRAVGEVRYPSSKLGDTLREGVDAGVGLEGVEASGLGERTVETSESATIWIHWCYLSSLVTFIFLLESALCGNLMLFDVILISVLRLKSYNIMKHEEVDNPPSVFHHLSSKPIPTITGWWFQPIWKIWVKMGSSSPNRGENYFKKIFWVATHPQVSDGHSPPLLAARRVHDAVPSASVIVANSASQSQLPNQSWDVEIARPGNFELRTIIGLTSSDHKPPITTNNRHNKQSNTKNRLPNFVFKTSPSSFFVTSFSEFAALRLLGSQQLLSMHDMHMRCVVGCWEDTKWTPGVSTTSADACDAWCL